MSSHEEKDSFSFKFVQQFPATVEAEIPKHDVFPSTNMEPARGSVWSGGFHVSEHEDTSQNHMLHLRGCSKSAGLNDFKM